MRKLLPSRQAMLILLLCLPTFLFAQSTLTLSANSPRANDKMERKVISVDTRQLLSEQDFWDVSETEVLGYGNLQFMQDESNRILKLGKGMVSSYKLMDNACWLMGYESPQSTMRFHEPLKVMSYPFSLGDTLQTSFTLDGIYGKKYKVRKNGEMKMVGDAQGKMLLNVGDTLHNVLRVHYSINSQLCMSNDSSYSDTLQMRQEKRDVYHWYVQGYRFPILEMIMRQVLQQGKVLTESSTVYLLSPSEQSSLLDRENETKRNSTQNSRTQSETQPLNDLQVNENAGKLSISYKLADSYKVKFIVSDVSGIIYLQKAVNGTGGLQNHEYMDCSSLRRGEYVLHAFVAGQAYTSKFSIH